jgi:hypothetical protein
LLSHCKLEGVRLRDNRAGAESDTDPLSFRDLKWLCFLPNERLDDRNLRFENVPMKSLKLRQVIDVLLDARARADTQLAALRGEVADAGAVAPATERAAMVDRVSGRYREILQEWHYPKADDAYVSDDLTPYTRGKTYTAASSGGRTLIALAWQLAVFEIAWESRSSHPGFLLLDSPQKNLGQTTAWPDGAADGPVIDRVYGHLELWLARAGAGAQIIVADNAPPPPPTQT